MSDLGLADSLQLGDTQEALRLLDDRIDSGITYVAHPVPYMPESALAARALSRAKTYRERHPSESRMVADVADALQDVEADRRDAQPGMLTKVGDDAPAFAVTTLDGAPFDLREQRGKVVVLNFLSPTCGPCLRELPYLERDIWEKYKDDGVAMIAVARDGTAEEISAIRADKALSFPMAVDGGNAAYAMYAEEYIPQTYVIDPAGKIAYQCAGFVAGDTERMAEVIALHLGE